MIIRLRVYTYVIQSLPNYDKMRIPASSKLRALDIFTSSVRKGQTPFMVLREPYFQELTIDVPQHDH